MAAIATVLVCFGGGMGWIRLVGDLIAGGGNVVDLVSRTLVRQHLGGRLAVLQDRLDLRDRVPAAPRDDARAARARDGRAAVAACLGRRPLGVLLAGVLAALLAPFQFFAFPATYLIVGPVRAHDRRAGAPGRSSATRSCSSRRSSSPRRSSPAPSSSRATSGRSGSCSAGARPASATVRSRSPSSTLTNLGIPFVLAIIAGVHGPRDAESLVPGRLDGRAVHRPERRRRQRGRVRHEQVLPDHVDRGRDPGRAGSSAAGRDRRSSSVLAGVGAVAGAHRRCGTCDRPTSRSGCPRRRPPAGSRRTRPERSVFITDAVINSPVDLAGRLRITTFGPYVVEPRLRPGRRARPTRRPSTATARRSRPSEMATYGATYVLSSGGDPCDGAAGTDFVVEPAVRDGLRRTTGSRSGQLVRAVASSPWARRRS